MRYTLIDGQGNFGSIDGDSAAAYRYTECRLDRVASEILADIEKETVDFVPNYDAKEQEPSVLPTKVPNLLINGSSGIAVGMATNIPPHNLGEVVDGLPGAAEEARNHDRRSDQADARAGLSTAGIIYRRVRRARGLPHRPRPHHHARAHPLRGREKGNRQSIIVDELPYQVNKKTLLERIAELVNDKKIEGIAHVQDESDKSGMRVVIELKRGEIPEVILNNLFKQTQLQDTFGINMVALPRRAAARSQSEGDAPRVPRAPARGGDAAHPLRPARGEEKSAHPGRARRCALQRRRGHRADQEIPDARRSEGRVDGQVLALAGRRRDA